jgi:outer membrane cobalamin receptor
MPVPSKQFYVAFFILSLLPYAHGQIYYLDPITVEAERPPWEETLSPGSVTVIEADEFKGEQKDLAKLLEHAPGIYVQRITGDGQYTVARVRGSTGAQVNVYVDGILQNVGNDMAVDLSLIPASNVERIEVYKGYIPSRFAGAPIGGVINIVTKRPEKLSVTAEIGFGSFGAQSYTLSAAVPAFFDGTMLMGGNYRASDGDFPYKTSALSDGYFHAGNDRGEQRRKYNGSEIMDFLFKWQNQSFSIKGAYRDMDRRLPFRTGEIASEGYYAQDAGQFDGVLGYNKIWDTFTLGIQGFYINQTKHNNTRRYNFNSAYYPIYPGALWSDRDTEKLGITADFSYTPGQRNLTEFHGDYSYEVLRVDANDWIWQGSSQKEYKYYPRYDENHIHLQLQDTITLGKDWDTWLTGIARADRVESTGNNQSEDDWKYSWGLALKKEINERITFKSSYGTFSRYPNFTERYGDGLFIMPTYIGAAKNYPPPTWEIGQQWDVALDLNGSPAFGEWRLSAAYFDRHTDNMVGMYTNRAFSYFVNAGMAHVNGVEVGGFLGVYAFSLSFAYTHQEGKVNRLLPYAGTATSSLSERITNIPKDQLMLRVSYNGLFDNKITVFSEYRYTGPIYKTRLEGNHEDSWVTDDALSVVNTGAAWSILKNLTLTAGINDLLNAGPSQGQHATNYTRGGVNMGTVQYNSILDYSSPGTTYYVTLRYEWQ